MKKLTISVVLFMLVQPIIQAQVETDTIKNYILEEITIKSPKYSNNVFDIPAAASMLPERFIENNKIDNLTDVSSFVPNFFMPDYGSKLTSPVYIRGVGNRINTPSIGLYVDEVPYFEKAAFNFDFYDIEQIDVLRGSQGTLYGRNAMGGLINITTKKPTKERTTGISADYGNYSQFRAGISHNQPIGEKFIVLASLNHISDGGFHENKFNNRKVDKLTSTSGRVKMQFTPSDRFTASLNVQYEDSRQGGYPYALFNTQTNTVGDINYEYESYYNRQMLSSGLILNYSASNFDVRSVTSLQSIDDLQVIDQDFTPQALFYANQDQQLNILAQEINIQSKKNETYDWLFGFFGFRQAIDRLAKVEYAPDMLAQSNMPFDEYYITRGYDNINSGAAIFHQSTLYFGDLSITAGLRVDYEQAQLDYIQDNVINGVPNNMDDTASDLDFFEILPKIAFKYSISEYLTPYATIAKGYNSGGFNDTFERDEDRAFDPEHSWNYEAGIKAKWLQQRIYTNLAIFYIDWTNQQIYQTVPSGTGSMLTNAGKSESKGVELEFKIIPAKNLETWVAAGYNDARFIEYVKDSNVDYSGNRIPYVPKFSFNLGANYSVDINSSWLDRVHLNATYNGTGKHYWNEDNIAFQNYYGLLNHRITFEKDNITVSFWGKNILNENYNSFYFQALGNSYA